MQLVGGWVVDQFKVMMDQIKQNNFESMDNMHHILAGIKAYFTDTLMVNIEQARRSAGGAGFSSNSGFTEIFQFSAPMPTYEGDNTVMLG